MTSSLDLSGRTAVVTGASSGIGRAVAERLGGGGAHVVLAGRNEPALDEAAARVTAAGGTAHAIVADLREPKAVRGLVDTAVGDTGRLDVMVNNAGLAHLGAIVGADPEHWRAMLETNVLGLLAGCSAAVEAMRACGAAGHIVNISSVAASRPDSGVYGATKHAVNVITNTLRHELADEPITVTAVSPGAVTTNFGRHLDPAVLQGVVAMSGVDAEVVPGERLPDDVLDAAQRAMSDMFISADDVADAVVFALSRPGHVVADLVVRPRKDLNLA